MASIKAEMNRLRECKEELEMVRTEKDGLEQQVKALKQVAAISNDMLKIREAQVILYVVRTTRSRDDHTRWCRSLQPHNAHSDSKRHESKA